MARPHDRAPVIRSCALALLLALLMWAAPGAPGPAHAAATASEATCATQPSAVVAGTTPVLFVHGINSGPDVWTSGKVEGSDQAPLPYVVNAVGADQVTGYTFDWSGEAGPPGGPVQWVSNPDPTKPSTGKQLAAAIHCLAQGSGRQVAVVAHSMGGLLAKAASSLVRPDISSVFTMGTPYEGSWLANLTTVTGLTGSLADYLGLTLVPFCRLHTDELACKVWLERKDTGIFEMRTDKAAQVHKLPSWPDGLPVYTLASDIVGSWLPVWPLTKPLDLGGVGDIVVGQHSQNPSGTGYTRTCRVDLGRSGPQVLWAAANAPCNHMDEPRYADLLKQVTTTLTAHPGTPGPSASAAPVDWNNRTYGLTCDDAVKTPVKVTVGGGKANVSGPDIGTGRHWEVQVQRVASGTLAPLGDVTAVMFYCSPQPSNYYVQEIRVYRTADGSEIGRVPTPDAGSSGPGLPPQYQPPSLSVGNGQVATDAKFYGPADNHATGPSVLRHLSWTWDGHAFAVVTTTGTPSTSAGGLGGAQVTVNGLGPVKLGMNHAEAAKAVGAPIASSDHPACEDVPVTGGPDGLLLRFVQDRLVAVSVWAPSSFATASGISLGSPRADVLTTYAGQVGQVSPDNGLDELAFAPTAPEFAGKVIVFDVTGGHVNAFTAGLREWAYLSPCPH